VGEAVGEVEVGEKGGGIGGRGRWEKKMEVKKEDGGGRGREKEEINKGC
jgi:hypothetical protein